MAVLLLERLIMYNKVKALNNSEMVKVEMLEQKLGNGVMAVAYEKKPMAAKLKAAQIKEVQMVEKESASTIVVYEKT